MGSEQGKCVASVPAEIRIGRAPDGRGFRLEAVQFVPRPRERVFEFFASAVNLRELTPPWLHFEVLTPEIQMQAGTLIDYRLRVRGIPVRWQSKISVWEPPLEFVDEQTRGPYRRWYHLHRFEAVDGGTLVHDIVDYAVPGGRLVHRLFVRPDLLSIFRYRQQRMLERFGHQHAIARDASG